MFCPECGNKVPDGALFCPVCGRYLSSGYTYEAREGEAQSTTYTCEPVYEAPQVRRHRGTGSLLVLAVVLVAALLLLTPYLTVSNQGELSGKSFSAEYSGIYTDDQYKMEYSWTYLGGSFSFDIPITKTDYQTYVNTNKDGRAVTDWSTCTDFVVLDSYTAAVVDALAELYESAFGKAPACDQAYANFILAYVQVAFTYMTDTLQYGQSEYYAYPVQTLVNLKGDCEDTSILCAALYKQAGFDAAVLIVPEHAMAGVALDSYTAPSISTGEILSQTVGGKTYYACETTTDSFQPVGVNYSSYSGHLLSYYLNRGKIGQGLYTFYEVD